MSVYRYEEKYVLSPIQYSIIKKRVEKILQLDKHSTDDGYLVTSIYFDDFIKRAVSQKLDGHRNRYKYRIRYYDGNTKHINIERKTKHNNQGFKTKLSITHDEYMRLLQNDYDFLYQKENTLAKQLVYLIENRKLSPIIKINYQREAFTSPFNDIRITFDKDLSYSDLNSDQHDVITKNIILEIKYNSFFPKYLKQLFGDLSLQKQSISKFLLCYLHKIGEDITL